MCSIINVCFVKNSKLAKIIDKLCYMGDHINVYLIHFNEWKHSKCTTISVAVKCGHKPNMIDKEI